MIRLTHWSLDLTGPAAVTAVFFGSPAISSGAIAGATHGFWLGLVRLLAHAWVFSFFWTVAAYLYLWLRQDVDGQPMTEIEPARREHSSTFPPVVKVGVWAGGHGSISHSACNGPASVLPGALRHRACSQLSNCQPAPLRSL